MNNQKPFLPKGTRDFGPFQMAKRDFILSTIKSVFQKFGYQPLETPAIENLSVLMGKYGDEGDQLLFKVLNSGDFLKNVSPTDLNAGYKSTLKKVAEKGLRYDLTVPFARYVAMNQHELIFPFKRYQIQPVWRADRPQKGRYREFYQCDADVVGSKSMICEAEIILMIQEIFNTLGIKGYKIKFNHRQVLGSLAKYVSGMGQESAFYVAIDKLEKIGAKKVKEELTSMGITEEDVDRVFQILTITGSTEEKMEILASSLEMTGSLEDGLKEIREMLALLDAFGANVSNVSFDLTLARGLSYYTGIIFEVVVDDNSISSLSGGGRYDDLTGAYNVPGIPGTGISLGVDRIYDLMESRGLFPQDALNSTEVLIAPMDNTFVSYALPILMKLRENGVKSEIYPDPVKLKKQMSYADKKQIPFVIIIGSDEVESELLTLKDMKTGIQDNLDFKTILNRIKRSLND